MKLIKGIAAILAWISITGVCLIFLGVVYWLAYPYPTTIVHNEPVPVMNEGGKVRPGEALKLHLVWSKYTPVGAEVSRLLINKTTREMTVIYSGTSAVPEGEHDRIISVPIPLWTPLGKRILRTTYIYEVNPLRKMSVSWESQEFEIVE